MKFKFAVVDGERREAQPGLRGKCVGCGDEMIAKCGEHNVWHWAHRGTRTCDPWWEQTEWHLAWKDQFPKDWQEKPHRAVDGEMHIADVKTDRGTVIEFQRSHLPREERESRENFYQKMVWVVYGLRRVLDKSRFFELLARASIVKAKPLTFSLPLNNKCPLLRDWVDSRKPVFFDFGDNSEPGDPSFQGPVLWRLEPRSPKGEVHLSPVLKTSYLGNYLKGSPLKGIDYSEQLRAVYAVRLQQAPRPQPLTGFQRWLARQERRRRRF